MRKFTKIAITLAAAAMLALGTLSTVMAAENPIIAEWSGNDDEGWTAVDTNGNGITRGWAVTEGGVWYYFSNGIMLADEFINYRGDTYYLGKDGAMATGWVKFDDESGVELELAQPTIDGNNVFGEDTAYEDYVWMHFAQNGVACKDTWFNDTDDLWYYFEGHFMVSDTFAYEIDGKNYGFSGHGNMHVGWVKLMKKASTEVGPSISTNPGELGWVYYSPSGVMASEGWNKIGGQWTYFVLANEVDTDPNTENIQAPFTATANGTFMVSDTYVDDYFIDCDGYLVGSGEITFSKNYTFFPTVDDFKSGTATKLSSAKSIYFEDGIRTAGPKNNSYYYDPEVDTIYEIDGELDRLQNTYTTVQKTADFKAEKLYKTFYVDENNNVFYYDEDGKIVKNDVIDFGGVMVAFNYSGKAITTEGKTKVNGTYYTFAAENGYIQISEDLVLYGASK